MQESEKLSGLWQPKIIELGNLSKSITNVLRLSQIAVPNLTAASRFSQFSKNNPFGNIVKGVDSSAIQAITKSFQVAKPFMPNSGMEAILALSQQQNHILKQLSLVATQIQKVFPYSQPNGLETILGGIASRYAMVSIPKREWDTLDDLEEVVQITERISNLEVVTKEDFEDLKNAFISAQIKTDKKSITDYLLKILFIIEVFWLFTEMSLAAINETKDYQLQSATRHDVGILRQEILDTLDIIRRESKTVLVIDRNCEVHMKPKMRSLILERLPINTEVVLMLKNQKWVYINYINPKDNLPEAGWILKKYVSPK